MGRRGPKLYKIDKTEQREDNIIVLIVFTPAPELFLILAFLIINCITLQYFDKRVKSQKTWQPWISQAFSLLKGIHNRRGGPEP